MTMPTTDRRTSFPNGLDSLAATTTLAGLMSATDKIRIDAIPATYLTLALNTDCTTQIQGAIDALPANGGTIVLPYTGSGYIGISSTILISKSNVTIVGQGPSAYRATQSQIQSAAGTRLKWIGAAGGTVVKFESPTGDQRQHGGGLRGLMIDGNNFSANIGLHLKSWSRGVFSELYVFACAVDHYLLDITTNVLSVTPYDTQLNIFTNCDASTRGGSGTYLTSAAYGFRLKGLDGTVPANSSFNYFYNCTALMSKGIAWMLENTDNNHFFACSGTAQRDGTVYDMELGSADQDSNSGTSNARYNFIHGCQLKIRCRASQTGGTSSLNNHIVLSRANAKPAPVLESGSGGANDATAVVMDSNGAITTTGTIKGAGVNTTVYTVATLPTKINGLRAFVSDANATTFASVVAGGGANKVPVYCDGADWRIG